MAEAAAACATAKPGLSETMHSCREDGSVPGQRVIAVVPPQADTVSAMRSMQCKKPERSWKWVMPAT